MRLCREVQDKSKFSILKLHFANFLAEKKDVTKTDSEDLSRIKGAGSFRDRTTQNWKLLRQ